MTDERGEMSSRHCLSADLLLPLPSHSIIPAFEVPLSAVIDHVQTQGWPNPNAERTASLGRAASVSTRRGSRPALRHAVICSGTLLALNRQRRRAARLSAVFVKADYEEG